MKQIAKTILLLVLPVILFAQKNNDSLRKALNMAVSDSARYFILSNLSLNFSDVNWDSALNYTEKSLLLSTKHQVKHAEVSDLTSKGYILMKLGKLGESLQSFQEALKLAEDPAIEKDTRWHTEKNVSTHKLRLDLLMNIHHSLGHLMVAAGMPDQTIVQYNKTKSLAEEINDTLMLGFVNMNLGNTYISTNKLDSALMMENEAARIFNQSGYKKFLSVAYIHIARIELEKKNNALALKNIHQAIQSAIEQNMIASLSISYGVITNYYLKYEPDKDSSLHYAKLTLATLQTMGSKDFGSAYENLYHSYAINNTKDSSYKYLELALTTKDSSYKARIKSLSEVQNLSFDEQFRLQELEKEKELTKTRTRTYALIAGLAVILSTAIFLYRNNRQKQKANKLLADTLSDLKSTQAQLIHAEKMASLGELTAGIAHEIQNPLNFVNNFSEINAALTNELVDAANNGNQKEIMQLASDIHSNQGKISEHGKRADAIVKGMLQHSRSSSGVKEPTDINKLADEYFRLAYHGLRATDKSFNAKLHTDFDPTIGKIPLIPQEIGRVLLNLYNNAFYAVAEKNKLSIEGYEPLVSVRTEKIDGVLEIHVADNGDGIPEKVLEKVFQPFFTTKPTGKGTGLGLSLSYDIIKANLGKINIRNTPGAGAEFIITLPIHT